MLPCMWRQEELAMNVFISHVADEGLLALVLKECIQKTTKNKVKVFVSSDIQNISAGDVWLENLEKALSGAKILIVLCSPFSVTRPWVNFEIGSAWIKHIPIIPICHSGLELEKLPVPLSSFHGLDINSKKFLRTLIDSLAKKANIKQKLRIYPGQTKKKIEDTLRKIKVNVLSNTRTAEASHDDVGVILKKIAVSDEDDCTCKKLAQSLRLGENDLDVYLRHLMDRRFIKKKLRWKSDCQYGTTRRGREYLVQRGLLGG